MKNFLQIKIDELEKDNEHLRNVIKSLQVERSRLLNTIENYKCLVF